MKSIRVAVGSKNPVKINAAKLGTIAALSLLDSEIEVEGFEVPSEVSEQPYGDDETLRGAMTRAINAFQDFERRNSYPPNYSVGLEGGVGLNGRRDNEEEEEMECFAWMIVFDGITFGKARTATFQLPPAIRDLMLKEDLELGVADDLVFQTSNSKQAAGTVGQLTKGVIDRTAYYEQAIILAYIPFIWPELYLHHTQT